jgi:phosphatidate cytidylyltransferase
LVPAAVAAEWAGGAVWVIAVGSVAALALWEWARLTGEGRVAAPGYAVIAAAGSLPLFAWVAHSAGLGFVGLCGVAAAIGGALRRSSAAAGLLCGVGTLYIGFAAIALVWLRDLPAIGLGGLLWLLAAVWAADVGAYLVGRAIGGPRLAPRLSPNKTWAGLMGSVVGAILVGIAFGQFWPGAPAPAMLAMAGLVLGIAGQGGDLLESAAKRHYGVKDSSGLIPGHGGVLDRVDALMAVVLLFALIHLAGGAGLTWS